MRHIAYYISDYGFGHASRSIAVIREILEKIPQVHIHVISHYPLQFLKQSFSNQKTRIDFYDRRNDVGFCTCDDLRIDKINTQKMIGNWISSWDKKISTEESFCKGNKISLIISDISPVPFLVAKNTQIQSMALSNFSWFEEYDVLFGRTKQVKKIYNAYSYADIGLILPFDTGLTPFNEKKKISLITRHPTDSVEKIRKTLCVEREKKIVYFGLGYSHQNKGEVIDFSQCFLTKYSILVSSNNSMVKNPVYTIKKSVTESQDYIFASDIVITKFGYSTISEAIYGKKPIFVLKRNSIEDRKGVCQLKKLGIAKEISICEVNEENIRKILENADGLRRNYNHLPSRFKEDGKKEVINCINQFIH